MGDRTLRSRDESCWVHAAWAWVLGKAGHMGCSRGGSPGAGLGEAERGQVLTGVLEQKGRTGTGPWDPKGFSGLFLPLALHLPSQESF